jgi:hypothetical protein
MRRPCQPRRPYTVSSQPVLVAPSPEITSARGAKLNAVSLHRCAGSYVPKTGTFYSLGYRSVRVTAELLIELTGVVRAHAMRCGRRPPRPGSERWTQFWPDALSELIKALKLTASALLSWWQIQDSNLGRR